LLQLGGGQPPPASRFRGSGDDDLSAGAISDLLAPPAKRWLPQHFCRR